jgi:hypothetical protein
LDEGIDPSSGEGVVSNRSNNENSHYGVTGADAPTVG